MGWEKIGAATQRLRQQHLLRHHRIIEKVDGSHIQVAGRQYRNFSSNDYLGLAQESSIAQAFADGIAEYGSGSTSSPVVVGTQRPHQMLIDTFCEWLDRPAALLFNSGFAANHAVIGALLEKNDQLIADKLSHASIIDAGVHSAAKFTRFAHNDTRHLQQRLTAAESDNTLVVTESVFSMDGDQAPLPNIARITQQQKAWLMVDDAHGVGVLGEGQGCLAEHDMANSDCQILLSTFGKAMGCSGAIVSGGNELIEYLTNFAREHIYSTAFPAAQACAMRRAIVVCQQQSWRRQQLQQLIHCFKRKAEQSGIQLLPSNTAIQPVLVGENSVVLALAAKLKEQGFWLTAIRPPTVPKGTARLRITLTANHSESDIDKLITALSKAKQEVACD